ncbi:MAG TPA: 50S ribosomal protein L20 [bacterium]|nr:50S ribosomal protein L20 [bacterium]
MTRVKRGVTARARHKRELQRAKGYRTTRSKHIKKARETNLHAGVYAYRDRHNRKRDMRRLWIVRINAAVQQFGLSYREFMSNLKKANIVINRKVLAELAVSEPKAFEAIIAAAKKA